MMKKKNTFSSPLSLLFLINLLFISSEHGGSGSGFGFLRPAEGKKKVHVPDELDDVVDGEEDESWKEWGQRRPDPKEFDPPPDPAEMHPSEFQAEMLKRHTGPSFGFVKLRLGVRRSSEVVPQIAMQWTNILRTGAVAAKFMAVDVNTIMFTMEKGQDTEELKAFILSQPEAYEIKIGDLVFRRPGDPPLEQVVEMLHKQEGKADGFHSSEEQETPKDEL
ncbi:hypothetical protein AAC387_Pa11g0177 [Persea americana]